MKITVFTPVAAASAAARASALTVAALLADDHDVVVVGINDDWPEHRAPGFADAIPWRERHRIEPRVPQSDLVLYEVTAERAESLGAETWLPFTHGLVSIDDLGRHDEATIRILREADALVTHEATDAARLAHEFDLAAVELALPVVAEESAPAPSSTGRQTVAATGSRAPLDGADVVISAIASDPVLRTAFAVALSPSDPAAPALELLATDLGVTVVSTARADVAVTFFGPAVPWADSFELLASSAVAGAVCLSVGGPEPLLDGSAVRLDPGEPVIAVLRGLRGLLAAPLNGDIQGAQEALSATRHARRLVEVATRAIEARPVRQVDEAFTALRTASAAVAAEFEADTALFRP